MDTAATTFPAELNVWFRPCRASNDGRPTRPREIAHTHGTKTLEVPPMRICAPMTGHSEGTTR